MPSGTTASHFMVPPARNAGNVAEAEGRTMRKLHDPGRLESRSGSITAYSEIIWRKVLWGLHLSRDNTRRNPKYADTLIFKR